MTARQAWKAAAEAITRAGGEESSAIARTLLLDALGVTHAGLIAVLDAPMDPGRLAAYESTAARAAAGEPVQYILGKWEFYGRTFRTDRRALIPRPETELLVEAALRYINDGAEFRAIDVGCGTGCIGVTMKLERPQALVTLMDVSDGALALSRENAVCLGADVRFEKADMRCPLPEGPYDLIVSNPPYINAADMVALPVNVREHEPALALFGGEDGLDLIRALIGRAADSLLPGGRMLLEVGYDQGEAVVKLFHQTGMDAEALPDYSGIPRVISARKGL